MRDLKLSQRFWFMFNGFWMVIIIASCGQPKTNVDLIVKAKRIYLCDSNFSFTESMAISDGKIVATGSYQDITSRYSSQNEENHKGVIFPGFIDAHSHFYGYALTLNRVDLKHTIGMEDIVKRLAEHASISSELWITGRGWDETKWESQGSLTNAMISAYFPDRPIFIKRIDGHLGLANNKALELAGVNMDTQVDGGEIVKMGGRLTGVLMDNAMNLIDDIIPEPTRETETSSLLKAQDNCLKAGLTAVTDAGLDLDKILLIDSLQKTGDLTLRLYIMANPSEENFAYFEENGPISNPKLEVSSFKLYADGSLGSRGAKLKESYCDHDNYTGLWVNQPNELRKLCNRIDKLGFQVNTHCIGDSANRKTLEIYGSILKGKNDKRWRIEHAQVVTPADRALFKEFSIIPSVQPTHATSDMPWVDDRICEDRMDGAYAYRSLLATNGFLPLGTDFPVEEIYPLETYFAAVHRQNKEYKPLDGFLIKESLSPSQAVFGMTYWAAKANKMENNIGSLEVGKSADFIVLDQDITLEKYMLKTRVLNTYLEGEAL